MKHAYITLDAKVANAYLGAPGKERNKLDYIVNSWLKNILYRKNDPKQQLFDPMDKAGAEAKAKGLIPEILDQILREIKQDMRNEKR